MERPRSITNIGWFLIFIGILPLMPIYQELSFSLFFSGYVLYLLFCSIGFILSGVYILKLKNWARWLLVCMMVFQALMGLGGVICFGPLTVAGGGVCLMDLIMIVTLVVVIPGLIISYFLFNKKANECFK